MTERLIGETGSKKRRRFLFVPIVLVACMALFVVAGAQAVHDETFQLDGDTVTARARRTSAVTRRTSTGTACSTRTATRWPLPAGFDDVELRQGLHTNTGSTFITNDTTTFATGSKDTLPISGWQCNFDNNVNSKIDVDELLRGDLYTLPTGDEILYFGIERNVEHRYRERRLLVPAGRRSVASSTGGAVTFTGDAHRTATCWSCPSSRAAAPSARSTSTAGTGRRRHPAR